MKIYLHIGLHKTGTKFFQNKIFKQIKEKNFVYNPDYLTQYICDLLKCEKKDEKKVYQNIQKEKKKFRNKKVLISREIMCGDLFSGYNNFKINIIKLKKAFPKAKIIIFLRNQKDWIVSCYKESVFSHHYQSFESFFNSKNFFLGFDYSNLNYLYFLNLINKNFKQSKIFLYEEFKNNPDIVILKLIKFLSIPQIRYKFNYSYENKGYNSLIINFLLIRYKILTFFGLKNFIHRPIYYFGKKSIPAGFKEFSCLPHKYWKGFYNDNEELKKKYYSELNIFEKVILMSKLKFFLKILNNFLPEYFFKNNYDLNKEKKLYYKMINLKIFRKFNLNKKVFKKYYL
tara:strand:+ start:198 stop:1223 length:1026 start_codon:yes stop_codon:yes gene_type:complete